MAGLSVQMSLVGTIQPEVSLKAQMNAATISEQDVYDDNVNNYTITPSFDTDIILSTKNKLMKEDLTIQKVSQYAIGNDAGGVTLILGGQ